MRLPVLPLVTSALFPRTLTRIAIGRLGSVRATIAALDADRRLFVVAQRENADDPRPEQLYRVGGIARVLKVRREGVGLSLDLECLERGRADEWFSGDSLAAEVTAAPLPPDRSIDPVRVRFMAEYVVKACNGFPPRRTLPLLANASPGDLAGVIAAHLDISLENQQRFLESDDQAQRVEEILDHKRIPFLGEGGSGLTLWQRLRRWFLVA